MMNRVSAPGAPSINRLQVLAHSRLSTATRCLSKLAWSWPPSASPDSLNHHLHMFLQTPLITACKFVRSSPPSASPKWLYYSVQVRMIIASECVSPHSLNIALKVRTIMASASAYLHTRSIMASKCISKLARLPPWSASPISLHHHLAVHL